MIRGFARLRKSGVKGGADFRTHLSYTEKVTRSYTINLYRLN